MKALYVTHEQFERVLHAPFGVGAVRTRPDMTKEIGGGEFIRLLETERDPCGLTAKVTGRRVTVKTWFPTIKETVALVSVLVDKKRGWMKKCVRKVKGPKGGEEV